MSKILLNNSKNDDENKEVKIFEILSEQQEKIDEKEFIVLKIYKSEIDKATENLKELNKLDQHYEPDYKLIVDRYTNIIMDDYGGYETLKQTIISTDQISMLGRDEL
jgi:hypothetical protein